MDAILAKNTNPINDLPVELLVQIFLLSEKQTHKSKPYYHLRLSWVCRHWRKIINGSPVFWTVIKFSPWKGQEFIRELLSRSASAELSVFSPSHSGSDKRAEEVLFAFRELLKHNSHRIKYLSIVWIDVHEMPNLLFGEVFPVLKAFKFCCRRMSTEPLAVVQSTKRLRYLEISLSSSSSLYLLQPSCHHLKYLNITFSSYLITRQFYFTCLSLCSNLESLTVRTQAYYERVIWDEFPSVITLPNLVFLYVDDCTFIDQLCAPALKILVCLGSPPVDVIQQRYLIFDEYDLSSVTNMSIRGFNISQSRRSVISIQGSTLMPSVVPFSRFDTIAQDVDLTGEMLPSISESIEPTQFLVDARYLNSIRGSPPSSFLPKLLSKLRNLEALSIDPYYSHYFGMIDTPDLEPFRKFYEEIFDALVSVGLRWLIIIDEAGHPALLRTLFEIINSYSSLSSLNKLTYRIGEQVFECGISGHEFGEELVKFLRVRREAGYDTLEIFEIEGGDCWPEEWITEAANLGTQIHRLRSPSNEHTSDFW